MRESVPNRLHRNSQEFDISKANVSVLSVHRAVATRRCSFLVFGNDTVDKPPKMCPPPMMRQYKFFGVDDR